MGNTIRQLFFTFDSSDKILIIKINKKNIFKTIFKNYFLRHCWVNLKFVFESNFLI